jgi:hypothetical protein
MPAETGSNVYAATVQSRRNVDAQTSAAFAVGIDEIESVVAATSPGLDVRRDPPLAFESTRQAPRPST